MQAKGPKGRNLCRRPAIALAGALALCVNPALADPHYHGQGGGVPRMEGPTRPSSERWGEPPHPAVEAWGGPAPQPSPSQPQFDPRRHNGYWIGRRWYYGPPPDAVERSPDFRPGFAPFRPGAFLPPQYQVDPVGDWGRFHLRRPPYGYEWVRAGDEFLLVSMSTGQIFDVVPGD